MQAGFSNWPIRQARRPAATFRIAVKLKSEMDR
jgi:hypothetical protein